MTRVEIEQIVNEFMIEELEIDEELIYPESRLKEDMRIDSLDIVDIAVIVDERFGFKLKVEEMREVSTLAQFYDYIEQKMSK